MTYSSYFITECHKFIIMLFTNLTERESAIGQCGSE